MVLPRRYPCSYNAFISYNFCLSFFFLSFFAFLSPVVSNRFSSNTYHTFYIVISISNLPTMIASYHCVYPFPILPYRGSDLCLITRGSLVPTETGSRGHLGCFWPASARGRWNGMMLYGCLETPERMRPDVHHVNMKMESRGFGAAVSSLS